MEISRADVLEEMLSSYQRINKDLVADAKKTDADARAAAKNAQAETDDLRARLAMSE